MEHPWNVKELSPKLKIERANKHVSDLNAWEQRVRDRDLHRLKIEKNSWYSNLFIEFDETELGVASTIVGDAIHNLRSALDVMFRQSVIHVGGTIREHQKFPIVDTAQKLKAVMDGGLEQAIKPILHDFIVDHIKPYESGNQTLWALHKLDIADKHQFIIPCVNLVGVFDVCLENDREGEYKPGVLISEPPYRFRLKGTGNFTVKDKGRASLAVLFPIGLPFQYEPVFPTLVQISEKVSGIIESFERLLGRTF